MLYGKYRFHCRFKDEAVLPHYKGSTFRGVFGRALKKVVCALKRQDCRQCLLQERCVYVNVFESPALDRNSANPHGMTRPHPFVIEPPDTVETYFPPGSDFEFSLLLFGTANDHLPYFIYAFDQMSRIGIGKKINGKRAGFSLNSVNAGNDLVYSKEDNLLKTHTGLRELNLVEQQNPEDVFRLRLILETPLRMKFENRLKADLPFHVLVRGMLRRISSLAAFHGNGEPLLDYRGLVKRAESVQTVEDHLEWFDWRRYSFRQDREMLMGGMAGSVVYEGEIGEFMPFVRFCSEVHLGKQTTFGLGKIKTEVLE